MKVPIARTHLTKKEFNIIRKPLESGWVVQGPYVEEFENKWNEYTGSKHSIAVTSCTTALHLSLAALGLKPNDEVMVRVQQNNTLQDIMGINQFGSRLSFSQAMKKIDQEDKGVLLLLSHNESSKEILSNISFLKGQKNPTTNDGPDSRIIGVGAQILKDLGITKIRLLGASAKYPLTGFDLEITEFIS